MFAKLLVPETEKPITMGITKVDYKDPSANILDAISNGTSTGVQLAILAGFTAHKLEETVFAHPTISEAIKEALAK
jgi:pyruvate/2-oxoglutarate dehydrogenase complex dihydrolipoamide dehydrogenase (E3) component